MHCVDPLSGLLRKTACVGVAVAMVVLTSCTHMPQDRRTTTADLPPTAAPVQVPAAAHEGVQVKLNARQYHLQMAQKITAANPQLIFSGDLPNPLASIPVIEVLLKADGSIERMNVLRTPVYHPHTVHTAMAAIERAAPFGRVSHLPKPWRFAETFLFNDDLKFQLRTMVEHSAQK